MRSSGSRSARTRAMSSSSFAPLAEAVPRVFRPFGAPPAAAAAEPAPAPGPSAKEVERTFGAGVERGRAEARAELETIGASFTDSLRELAEFRARLKERYERELLELALGVARKVVQQELAERPEIWLGMIRAAVKRAVDRERIALRVPPPLMAFLRGSLAALRASLQDVKDLELVEDPSLPAGGCVIESRFGEGDIGVGTQLGRCERAVAAPEEAGHGHDGLPDLALRRRGGRSE